MWLFRRRSSYKEQYKEDLCNLRKETYALVKSLPKGTKYRLDKNGPAYYVIGTRYNDIVENIEKVDFIFPKKSDRERLKFDNYEELGTYWEASLKDLKIKHDEGRLNICRNLLDNVRINDSLVFTPEDEEPGILYEFQKKDNHEWKWKRIKFNLLGEEKEDKGVVDDIFILTLLPSTEMWSVRGEGK